MKIVIKTKTSTGSENMLRRGVQFNVEVTDLPGDTADDVEAGNKFLNMMRSDIMEMGYRVFFQPRRVQLGETRNDPQNAAMQKRVADAENNARQWKRKYLALMAKIVTGLVEVKQ